MSDQAQAEPSDSIPDLCRYPASETEAVAWALDFASCVVDIEDPELEDGTPTRTTIEVVARALWAPLHFDALMRGRDGKPAGRLPIPFDYLASIVAGPIERYSRKPVEKVQDDLWISQDEARALRDKLAKYERLIRRVFGRDASEVSSS